MNNKLHINKLFALSSEKRKFSFTIPLKNKIRIGKRDYTVQLRSDDKFGTYILWKNRKYPVEVVRSRQNKYEILFNDISYTFTIETPFSLQRMKVLDSVRGKSVSESVKAPMPGKLLDVLVREGSTILRGEPLVILEAMKMQNEIQSPVNGTIVKVHAKPNTNVMKDDVLVEIKTE
ncbi:MAG TPA: acetyl-CoA carboxylase biotin carboxyl carrier protein subunit [Bacteroidales bacterium]|jgi:biotin carboxyl carrier protein|nr:acetyl-CoA carboxylase biotin carboxyl carrier protein subunit [Bacteroidales bacterium]HOX74085.1 acetyl-CoA carboxylase biotin carboxyl carrier protein subunit [Bacteroidales bacterium]HPM87626.1 acetyl-CoA carboxylase biotin carboxyl carrier protein subunit [Bacteroidales bacterium]HQM69761.1 acetyl-CoA carboxylase biotin carboxyl carrier protein subunit [Bacteroidales bacterium]